MTALMLFLILIMTGSAWSHFGMLIPSDSMMMQDDDRTVTLTLSFSHPFEMVGMELVKPKAFDSLAGGKKQDLLGSLEATRVMGHKAWKPVYPIKRPGGLEAVIESVLDRKLKPTTRMLADMQQEGPTVRDIFAGIGYIFGIVGVAAYVQSRKKKE